MKKAALGFVVLAHDQPDNVARLIDRLTAQGGVVALHWDRRHPVDMVAQLKKELPASQAARVLAAERVEVHWGLWSVVQATLNGLQAIQSSGQAVDYVTLLSGHDYPLRPLRQLQDFLQSNPGLEHIECVDHEKERWVTDGLHDERWQYRHYISWGTHPKLFDKSWHLQRALGLKVRKPRGLQPHFGSQWWTLSWPTLEKVLAASREPQVRKFFRRTWVPDEMFFQTLVAKFVSPARITGQNLNFYHFSKQGTPLVLHRDHLSFLRSQPHFFARKISPRAKILRDDLDTLAHTRLDLPPPVLPLKKHLGPYEQFQALPYRGLPNRRVIGRQVDLWWGDMEYNRRPYIAILAPHNVDLTSIYQNFASQAGLVCFGDLFHNEHIYYGAYAAELPLYRSTSPKVRDLKRPNFLFDIIQSHPGQQVVFSIRLPCNTEMSQMVMVDPHCSLFIVANERNFYEAKDGGQLLWEHAFNNMILSDHYWQAVKHGKTPILLGTSGDRPPQLGYGLPPLTTMMAAQSSSPATSTNHGNGQHAEDGSQAFSPPPDESAAAEHQRTATHLASGLPS